MIKITRFTKANLGRQSGFMADAEKALRAVAEQYGLAVSFGSGKFSDTEFTVKTVFKVADPQIAADAKRASFNMWCKLYGLTPEHYGVALPPYQGVPVTLVGFNPKKPKYALEGRTADGRTVNYSEQAVFHLKTRAA